VCPTVQFKTLKFWFLWYLLLEVFTCTSFPVQNPITSVFKVRCLSTTGFLRWLNTLPTYNQNTTKVPLEGGGFRPNFSVTGAKKGDRSTLPKEAQKAYIVGETVATHDLKVKDIKGSQQQKNLKIVDSVRDSSQKARGLFPW
jgi:hypothetical protein